MKLSLSCFCASSAALALASVVKAQELTENPRECLTVVDESVDYFPDKVTPIHSKLWSISYHNTYKILQNKDDNTTYVLYMCGTDPPSDIQANLTILIPLQEDGIALSQTPDLSHLELLGLRDQITAYLGDTQWISSPCMQARIHNNETINIRYPDDDGAMDRLFAFSGPDILLFRDGYFQSPEVVSNQVTIAAWMERTNHGIAEWHKFFSVFFNLERKANEDFDGMYERYECTKRNANFLTADEPVKPKVVFADFSTYCGGWSVGSCPNFYCDHVRDCAAEVLEDDNLGSIVNPQCGTEFKYKTTAEFVEFAKDADVWIYPGFGDYYVDEVFTDFADELGSMKSVQEQQLYDTVLTGLNTWFEHRIVEYDLVLEDFCKVLGRDHELIPHQRAFLRNVFTEGVGDLGECTNPDMGFEIRAGECVELVELLIDSSDSPSWLSGMKCAGWLLVGAIMLNW